MPSSPHAPLPDRLRRLLAWCTQPSAEAPKLSASFRDDDPWNSPRGRVIDVVVLWWSSDDQNDAICFTATHDLFGYFGRHAIFATWNGDELDTCVSVLGRQEPPPGSEGERPPPAPPNESVTISEARALATAFVGYPVCPSSPRDGGAWWFFAVQEIGSFGVVVDKKDGRVTSLGSAGKLEDWLWGYDHQLVHNGGHEVDLVVSDVRDVAIAATALAAMGTCRGCAWATREALATLPARFRMSWMLISEAEKLRSFSPLLFRWRAEPVVATDELQPR